MMADMRLREECVAGDIYIADAAVCKAKHFSKLTPTLLKDLAMIALVSFCIILADPLNDVLLCVAMT